MKPTIFTRMVDPHLPYEIDLSRTIMPFGKHKGTSLDNIELQDPEYIEWMIKDSSPHSWIRNDRLMNAIEYCYLRIYHRKNKTEWWGLYCRELRDFQEEISERTGNMGIQRLLHRRKEDRRKEDPSGSERRKQDPSDSERRKENRGLNRTKVTSKLVPGIVCI
jgi:uncharacterized protein (DUF3820 family)